MDVHLTLSTLQKPAKSVNLMDNETYMKRVYGKTAYQPQRSTQKEPYLRYQSLPKSQLSQPAPPKAMQVKGKSVLEYSHFPSL